MRPTNRYAQINRKLRSVLSRLDRSRTGQASTGSFLENMSKLLSVLAIVVGGGWVLLDYFDFGKRNKELSNAQIELANAQTQLSIQVTALTQLGTEINNKLNEVKLQHISQKRLDSDSESSVVRAETFEDGTALYRFQFNITVKNISETNILIPALVIEFFLGKTDIVKNLSSDKAFLVNQPTSFMASPLPGSIQWSRLLVNAMRLDRVDDKIAREIEKFTPMSGGFCGELRPGESSHWNADFVIRARPEDMVGAVATYWAKGEGESYFLDTQTRTELLSEAEDTAPLKAKIIASARVDKNAAGDPSPPNTVKQEQPAK
jgi:hypothetical protein